MCGHDHVPGIVSEQWLGGPRSAAGTPRAVELSHSAGTAQGLRHPPAPSPAHGLAFPAERCIAATLRSSPGSRSWHASSESRWANGSIVSLRPTNRTVTCLRSPSNPPNVRNGVMRGATRASGDHRGTVAGASGDAGEARGRERLGQGQRRPEGGAATSDWQDALGNTTTLCH